MLLIKIVNDGTGDKLAGNYCYQVFINSELISSGKIKNHNRSHGWKELVSDFNGVVNKKEE